MSANNLRHDRNLSLCLQDSHPPKDPMGNQLPLPTLTRPLEYSFPVPPGASRIGLLPLAKGHLHFLHLLTMHFPKQDIKGRETEGFRGFAASAPGKTRHSSLSEIASLREPVGHGSPPATAEQKIEFVSLFPRPPPCLLPSLRHPPPI